MSLVAVQSSRRLPGNTPSVSLEDRLGIQFSDAGPSWKQVKDIVRGFGRVAENDLVAIGIVGKRKGPSRDRRPGDRKKNAVPGRSPILPRGC